MDEFLDHWYWCKRYRTIVYGPRVGVGNHTMRIANVEAELIRIKLTYRKGNETVTYISRMDGSNEVQKIDGVTAYATLKRYYAVPDLTENEDFKFSQDIYGKCSWCIQSAKQLQFYNIEKSGQRFEKCYGYDLNSSFSYAMLKPIPDTSKEPKFRQKVGPNEIGFMLDGDITFSGYAHIIFPLMESPFKRFINVWYGRKVNAKNPEEKQKAKEMLNFCIGYLQRKNPFIRNTIVWRSNKFIEELMDENTLYCNTDSIVSSVRRKDIEKNLGNDIGQWKIEHKGSFAFRGYSYQWGKEIPTYKGIAKAWFETFKIENGRPWDLLIDPVPKVELNMYYLDRDTMEIKKRRMKKNDSKS